MTMSSSKKPSTLDARVTDFYKKSKPSFSPKKRKTITLNSKNPIYKKLKLNPGLDSEWHESLVPKSSISEETNQNHYTTPTPTEAPHYSTTPSHRDFVLSDTSFASSRPSPACQNKNTQISKINNYLSLNKFHIKLKDLSSKKDISETLKCVLSRLDYPLSNTLEEDLPLVLKFLKCPVEIHKSSLKYLGNPLRFHDVLNVIHWLVQFAFYNEHVANSTNAIPNDNMFDYCVTSYLHYIYDDDDAVDREDAAFSHKKKLEVDMVKEKINANKENLKELEAKLKVMRPRSSLREVKEKMSLLEKEKQMEEAGVERKRVKEARVEMQMEEKEKQLRDKVEKRSIISAENEKLKWKELKVLQFECNQAIRSLKLGNGFEFELNAKGSTLIEVLGDYKSKLKHVLKNEELKTRQKKMENLESKVWLQQVSNDIAAMIKAKESRIAILESQIDKLNDKNNLIQKDTQDYLSSCEMKARQLQEKLEADSRNVDLVEKQAHEFLKNTKAELLETSLRGEEEVQMCAYKLLALIDSVSKYKEFTASKISQMKEMVSETTAAIAQLHNESLASRIGTLPQSEV